MEKLHITSPGWLLKQDNMALINQCRKYIQMEFGVRLLFSQPDLIEQIREFSSRSRNRKLIEQVRDLEQRLLSHQTEAPQPAPALRLYRGQSVTATTDPAPAKPQTLRIYRGQIMAD